MGMPRKVLDNSNKAIPVIKRQQKEAQEALLSDLSRLKDTDPPIELRDKKATETWKRIIPLLMELPVLCEIDRDNLIGYCNAWSEYCELIDDQKRAKEIDDIVVKAKVLASLGNRMEKVQNAHRRYGALCGMSLDSRLKLAAIKTKQEAETVEQKFGVI